MSWSGGKDSALVLNRCINLSSHNIIGLLTTINAASQRISVE
ncbi:MAG TPA: ATP-binding protein, partial [Bacteroidales bacterium]|nr:ATP-binding protein [Bacteroidales bacterium]